MILKASQRGGARSLARHLLNRTENDHVELHDLRGFLADDLYGALLEVEATAKGTKARQFFFSVSLSPPPDEDVAPDAFEDAARKIEERLELTGQPRALIFHEKDGRRHAHAVWSRIDADAMRAINLSHFKRKLNAVSRELFLEHGWELPDGYKRGKSRDPLNFTLEEWQQAKRAGRDPKALKATVQACWQESDNRPALQNALAEQGLFLAKGDRRGFVVMDVQGAVYALARLTGERTKAIRERLGDPDGLPGTEETKARIAKLHERVLGRHLEALNAETAKRLAPLKARHAEMKLHHRQARREMGQRQKERWVQESRARQTRFSKGLRGIWDWLRGRHSKLRQQNARETERCRLRDQQERQALIQEQLQARRALEAELRQIRARHAAELARLHRDLARSQEVMRQTPDAERTKDRPRRHRRSRARSAERERRIERGPEPE